MQPKPALVVILILISLAAGWQLWRAVTAPGNAYETGDHAPAADAETTALHARIRQLEAELASEKASHAALQQRLQDLRLSQLEDPDGAQGPADATDSAAATGHTSSCSSIPALQALIDAGISPATAEAMRDWIGENRLAMLNLRDRAEREGWLNSTRYATELRKLIRPANGLRELYGDAMYDRYLYATDKANRVIAAEVYPASAAGAAGILPGDVVLSYAASNIYSMNDLKQATLAGEAGESVLVLLQRDGMYYSITVPRGPLGIEMRMESHAPE